MNTPNTIDTVLMPRDEAEALRRLAKAAVEWANVFCDPDKTKREQYQAGVKLCGPIGLYEGIMQQKEANQ